MSATLPNIRDLATWLDAELFTTEYRPVKLSIRLMYNRQLHAYGITPTPSPLPSQSSHHHPYPSAMAIKAEVKPHQYDVQRLPTTAATSTNPTSSATATANTELTLVRSVQPYDPTLLSGIDSDGMITLCLETMLTDKKSVMVFGASKDLCNKSALKIAECLMKLKQAEDASYLTPPSEDVSSSSGGGAMGDVNATSAPPSQPVTALASSSTLTPSQLYTGRRAILSSLAQCNVGLCPTLRKTVLYGVAYHHSSLTSEERKIVETGFREGYLQVS